MFAFTVATATGTPQPRGRLRGCDDHGTEARAARTCNARSAHAIVTATAAVDGAGSGVAARIRQRHVDRRASVRRAGFHGRPSVDAATACVRHHLAGRAVDRHARLKFRSCRRRLARPWRRKREEARTRGGCECVASGHESIRRCPTPRVSVPSGPKLTTGSRQKQRTRVPARRTRNTRLRQRYGPRQRLGPCGGLPVLARIEARSPSRRYGTSTSNIPRKSTRSRNSGRSAESANSFRRRSPSQVWNGSPSLVHLH